jgi:hypothetical protein
VSDNNKFESSRASSFTAKVREHKGYFEASIPPHTIAREDLKKGDEVRFVIEAIKRGDGTK